MAKALTVRYASNIDGQDHQAYTLEVTVTAATDMEREIFMFQRAEATDLTVPDSFVCIADPVDLDEVPKNTPDLANEMPYYRLSTVTLSFRSEAALLATKADIASDIAGLVSTLNSPLVQTEEVVYA